MSDQITIRALVAYWQAIASLDDQNTVQELAARLDKLYSSLGYYMMLMPDDLRVPAPGDVT